MSGIYLEPESTFSVSVLPVGGAQFEIKDGGGIVLRTLTGREHGTLTHAIRSQDSAKQYDILGGLIISGIEDKAVGRLHPNAVAVMLFEILKRSHLSEEQAGN